jgi:Bacterial macroglobulin domain 6/Alpha-2-macroglobulin bait region domain
MLGKLLDGKPLRSITNRLERGDKHVVCLDGSLYRNIVGRSEDEEIASGTLNVPEGAPAALSQLVTWGQYRLVVDDPETKAATSIRFVAGWAQTAESADTPDKVEVTLEKPTFKVGETARLRVKGPFAGKAQLTIAGDRVFETRLIDVAKDGTTIEVKPTLDWGGGAYAIVSLYRPLASGRPHDGICRSAHVLSGRFGHLRQGARQARICPRGFGCCSACSASRFPRTSLRVRGFAGAGGGVDFGGKRAAGGTFSCSACDVCFIRSAKFSAGAESDEPEAHPARFASIAASCARACASSSWETVPAGLPLRSTRQAPCRSRR